MIKGDSIDYELLAKWASECTNKNLSCEMGVNDIYHHDV